jgi:hypothetical protein
LPFFFRFIAIPLFDPGQSVPVRCGGDIGLWSHRGSEPGRRDP